VAGRKDGRFSKGRDARRFEGRTANSHELTREECRRGYASAERAVDPQWLLFRVRRWYSAQQGG
jgi:hypothetical protein